MSILRAYVQAWPSADLANIPSHCRVEHLSSGDDISFAAVNLVQCELKGGMDEQAAAAVRLMSGVFIAAQNRLREILARNSDPSVTTPLR